LADESITIATEQITATANDRTLDELQARLDPDVFWRVHRSHLVNINKIQGALSLGSAGTTSFG
jgi:two-component system response regulator LytT